jgi:hypothetical protein
MMMKDNTVTKKLLVGYDPSKHSTAPSDFLVPMRDSTGVFLLGLKSRKSYEQGQMVYIGKEIATDDIFAKLSDLGYKFDDKDAISQTLNAYLRMLKDYKIGNILRIEQTNDTNCDFRLIKIADHEPFQSKKLP